MGPRQVFWRLITAGGNDASRQIVDCLAGVKNDFNDDHCVDDPRPCTGWVNALGFALSVAEVRIGRAGLRGRSLRPLSDASACCEAAKITALRDCDSLSHVKRVIITSNNIHRHDGAW